MLAPWAMNWSVSSPSVVRISSSARVLLAAMPGKSLTWATAPWSSAPMNVAATSGCPVLHSGAMACPRIPLVWGKRAVVSSDHQRVVQERECSVIVAESGAETGSDGHADARDTPGHASATVEFPTSGRRPQAHLQGRRVGAPRPELGAPPRSDIRFRSAARSAGLRSSRRVSPRVVRPWLRRSPPRKGSVTRRSRSRLSNGDRAISAYSRARASLPTLISIVTISTNGVSGLIVDDTSPWSTASCTRLRAASTSPWCQC